MPILPIDSGRYGSKEIREIFEDERRLQYQLDFEATVAQVQARLEQRMKLQREHARARLLLLELANLSQ